MGHCIGARPRGPPPVARIALIGHHPGMPNPALIVHGGAWDIPDAEVSDHREALAAALATGRERLRAGDPALDVVVAVIASLEDHPALDAGIGAVLNRAGGIQLDAGIMDGASRDFGAVVCARRIRHPIAAAAHLVRRGHRQCSLLAGADADAWAAAEGLETVDPETFILRNECQFFYETIPRWKDERVNRWFDTNLRYNDGDTIVMAMKMSIIV